MSTVNRRRVLAIGIDAAEATLVRQLIDNKELPALASLLREGCWLDVASPANIGSGAVWPTFMTGEEPAAHGIYGEWRWCPETMSLGRHHSDQLTPFWKSLAARDVSIGVFDVPFALPIGVSNGFEVCEWWAHDATGAGLQAAPEQILSLVNQSPAHPLSAKHFVNTTPDSQKNLAELSAACVAGVRLRGALAERLISETKPRLSLLVFPEVHHAGHQMWHTVDPDHPVYRSREPSDGRARDLLGKSELRDESTSLLKPEPLLKDVYRAVDREIGRLVKTVGSEANVIVFSLHGMRPALGVPAFLGQLLCERGFARVADLRAQSWTTRALSVFAAAKRHSPEAIKKIYYKLTPQAATHKLARPTMLPPYDWANTRAFSLPTDQHGWIRINLAGREARGCVPLEQYEKTCKQLEQVLIGLTTEDGQPLVEDITRTAANATDALSNPLPDLVVHWGDAVFASPLKIKDSRIETQTTGKKYTGQHASPGFCIYRGERQCDAGAVVAAKDFAGLITAAFHERD